MSGVFLFAGPSLYGSDKTLITRSITKLLPPAKRNDIPRLIEKEAAGVIILADGNFHNVLAVGHVELRTALDHGWDVWGCSSMGAIRACEMANLGMKGYGAVYKLFMDDPDFRDDEVALLHSATSPYMPVSEPLVNIRFFLNQLVDSKMITAAQSSMVIENLEACWYGERTLYKLKELLGDSKPIMQRLENFAPYRIKNIDLQNMLLERPWIQSNKMS